MSVPVKPTETPAKIRPRRTSRAEGSPSSPVTTSRRRLRPLGNQSGSATSPTAAVARKASRQPPRASLSGTIAYPAAAAPAAIAATYQPVTCPGLSGNSSLTTAGRLTLVRPSPIPIGTVIARSRIAVGISARTAVKTVIRTSPASTLLSEPMRSRRRGPTSANTPMHRNGIIARTPASVLVSPRSPRIISITGPTTTIAILRFTDAATTAESVHSRCLPGPRPARRPGPTINPRSPSRVGCKAPDAIVVS